MSDSQLCAADVNRQSLLDLLAMCDLAQCTGSQPATGVLQGKRGLTINPLRTLKLAVQFPQLLVGQPRSIHQANLLERPQLSGATAPVQGLAGRLGLILLPRHLGLSYATAHLVS